MEKAVLSLARQTLGGRNRKSHGHNEHSLIIVAEICGAGWVDFASDRTLLL